VKSCKRPPGQRGICEESVDLPLLCVQCCPMNCGQHTNKHTDKCYSRPYKSTAMLFVVSFRVCLDCDSHVTPVLEMKSSGAGEQREEFFAKHGVALMFKENGAIKLPVLRVSCHTVACLLVRCLREFWLTLCQECFGVVRLRDGRFAGGALKRNLCFCPCFRRKCGSWFSRGLAAGLPPRPGAPCRPWSPDVLCSIAAVRILCLLSCCFFRCVYVE
jgi:hypothetical protein